VGTWFANATAGTAGTTMKTLSFATGALLAACSDNQLHSMGDDAQPREAAIEVTPARIDFGSVTDAEGVAVEHVTISSVGASDLLVEDVSIGGKDASRFRILDDHGTFLLPAGASVTLEVEFEPGSALDAVAEVVVTSDDPVRPVLPVDLHGADAVPRIAIEPDPADFGVVQVGCERSRPMEIVSVGDEAVTVDSIAATGDGYSLSYGFSLPQTLAPGESLTVDLSFAPDDEREFGGTLEVVSDDYEGVQAGKQFGAGAFVPSRDEWVLEDLRADVLFFVDHSGSMDDDAAALAANFEGFITHLDDYSSDWQIVVADNNAGCNLKGILSPSVPDYDLRFANAVTANGLGVDNDEAGLTVAALAVDQTDAGECNEGFLREEALLHVILVSDEPDQSVLPWDHYVGEIAAKKGDASLVRISAIAGTAGSSCGATEGFGYEEAVAATGGVYLDICSDWATTMSVLADEIVTRDTFPLDHEAVPGSLTVSVDGQQLGSGWTYEAASNSVVFDPGSAPTQGSTVIVDYGRYGVCE
jgi:hypothetical protein